MENDMKELLNGKLAQNQSYQHTNETVETNTTESGVANQSAQQSGTFLNESLHLQSFFNKNEQNRTAPCIDQLYDGLNTVSENSVHLHVSRLSHESQMEALSAQVKIEKISTLPLDASLGNTSYMNHSTQPIDISALNNPSHVNNTTTFLQTTLNRTNTNNAAMQPNMSSFMNNTTQPFNNSTRVSQSFNESAPYINTSKSDLHTSFKSSASLNNSKNESLTNKSLQRSVLDSSSMNNSRNKSFDRSVSQNKSVLDASMNNSKSKSICEKSISQNGSELDSTEEGHQDVLSESFQYYAGEELVAEKENDLNRSNLCEVPVLKQGENFFVFDLTFLFNPLKIIRLNMIVG